MNNSLLDYDIDVSDDDDFDITECEDWEADYERNIRRHCSNCSSDNKHNGIYQSDSSLKNEPFVSRIFKKGIFRRRGEKRSWEKR